MDSYQPIYDAVRSRISNGDIGQAVYNAVNDANIGHYAEITFRDSLTRYDEYMRRLERPHVIYHPVLMKDGNKWCALYGENIQNGVCGFGDSPAEAMAAFDEAWHKAI